jgi:hypothetical protein
MAEVTPADLADLPAPVRLSLERSGVVGTPIPKAVAIRQRGRIRSAPDQRWLPFKAKEAYSLDPPAFTWRASLKAGPLTVGRAVDTIEGRTGRMHVKLLGMFTLVDAQGPEMDQGALMRWLNETMWFPAVWVTPTIRWEPVDDRTALGSVSAADLTVRGEFRFDAAGRLVDFAADRYRSTDSGFELTPWSTPLTDHAEFDGITVPSVGSGMWHLDGGDFEYVQIEVTDVTHPPAPVTR